MSDEKQFSVGRKIVSSKTGKPPFIRNKYQVLIWQLIKNPNDFCHIEWSRETKAAKLLYFQYPDINFWRQLDLGFYLNSLNFFSKSDGLRKLREAIDEYELSKKVKFSTKEKEKRVENLDTFHKEIKTKKQDLRYGDFFKHGKKTK